ncbi:hypothetical protein [Acidocella sp.]|jgi:hypothetical protein|uniref:hypothetical protein n=1 Tax=Acidocella sp. TaxID=50710 RepID=UPI002F412549
MERSKPIGVRKSVEKDMAKEKVRQNPPSKVSLVYKVVGANTHVFTTNDFRGFYVGNASLRAAFDGVARALGEHVSLVYGTKTEYVLDMSFEAFATRPISLTPTPSWYILRMAWCLMVFVGLIPAPP